MKVGINLFDDSFTLINRIFNNNKNLITVYKLEKDLGIWGSAFNDADPTTGSAFPGMHHVLAMDNFLQIFNVLDNRNYNPELRAIGFPSHFFRHLAFVMLLHEVAEGHYLQNLGYYKDKPEYLEIDEWVDSDDPYVPAHLMALKAQARELGVDMCRSQWFDMDEREGQGTAYDVRMTGSNDTENKNGAECLVTYKKQINGTYIKCTYAFRIKKGKFYNEKTVPGRRWDNTFGCVMMIAPDMNRTVMTGVISGATYRYEMYNYVKSLNANRRPRRSPRLQLGPEPPAPSPRLNPILKPNPNLQPQPKPKPQPKPNSTPNKKPKKDQTVIWPIMN